MSPNGTHPKAESQTATIRVAVRRAHALESRFLRQTNIERAFQPGSMPLHCDPDRGCLSLSLRMRAVWRHDVFMTRAIRQKNGMDTLYTLHTSTGSGDAVLTNEKLPRVASRRREVVI